MPNPGITPDPEPAGARLTSWANTYPWTVGVVLAAVIVVIVLITWYLARPGFPAEPPVNSFCDNAWHAVIYTSQSGDIAVGPKC